MKKNLNKFIVLCMSASFIFMGCTKKIEKVWDKSYGGTDEDHLAVVVSTSDGYLLCGYSKSAPIASSRDGKKTAALRGGFDYWIVKTDKQGNYQWDKSYGGSGDDVLTCAIPTDNGFVLGGYSNSPGSSGEGSKTNDSRGGNDYWIVKIDNNGRTIFDKTYGGSGTDKMASMLIYNNVLLLGGTSNSLIDGDKSSKNFGGDDYWIVKTDLGGNYQWDKTFGGNGEDFLTGLTPYSGSNMPENEIYVFCNGYSNSGVNEEGGRDHASKGMNDYWTLTLRPEKPLKDIVLTDFNYGGSDNDELNNLLNVDNEMFWFGTSSSGISGDKAINTFGGKDYWIMNYNGGNSSGRINKGFGGNGNEILHDQQREGAGFLLGGQSSSGKSGSKSEESFGGSDFWLVRTDGTMNVFSDKSFGGSGDDVLYSIQAKSNSSTNKEFVLGGSSNSPVSGNKQARLIGGKDFWLVNILIKE